MKPRINTVQPCRNPKISPRRHEESQRIPSCLRGEQDACAPMVKPRAITTKILAKAARLLAERDRHLAVILERHGTPPMWAREPGFSTLVKIVLEQQVSLASARSTFERLMASVKPFSPGRIVRLGETHLRSQGITRQKSAYIKNLAQAVLDGTLSLKALSFMNDEDAKAELTKIVGIGPWTADIYLLMALRRPDIWPSSDLALVTSLCKIRSLRERPPASEVARLAEVWRPFRSVAARMLWQYYLAGKGGQGSRGAGERRGRGSRGREQRGSGAEGMNSSANLPIVPRLDE